MKMDNFFKYETGSNGDRVSTLSEDAPDVLKEFLREVIHDDHEFPNHWLFEKTHGAFIHLTAESNEKDIARFANLEIGIFYTHLLYSLDVLPDYQYVADELLDNWFKKKTQFAKRLQTQFHQIFHIGLATIEFLKQVDTNDLDPR